MTVQIEDIETHITVDCKCGRPAKLIAHRHLIDACNGGLAETPDGAEVQPVCVGCARLLHGAVAIELMDRLDPVPEGFLLVCRTCSRPITAMHDVLDWEKL